MRRPTRDEVEVFESPADFRSWLEQHHATSDAVWVAYYRKDVPKESMTYGEAVEVALCYGWIDGIGYRVDDEVSTNRFTPRRTGSYWSTVNIAKVERLTREGLMAPAGLRAFEARDQSSEARYSYENRPADLPPAMLDRLRGNPDAARYWEQQTPGYRRAAAFWVISAKREETRLRRLEQLTQDAAAGRPIKMLSYGRDRSAGR